MNARPLDPERIAAFLDGLLDPAERGRFLEQLADDEEARRVLREAAAVRAELESTGAREADETPFVDARSVRSLRWAQLAPWSAAAVLVLAVSAILLSRGAGRKGYLVDARELGGDGPIAAPSWSVQRGSPIALPGERRDYRLGGTIVQLRSAVARGDVEAAAYARNALTALLRDLPGSGVVVATLQPDNGDPADTRFVSVETVDQAAAAIRGLLETDHRFDLGIWTEQLRQALRSRTHEIRAGREAASAAALAGRLEHDDAGDELSRRLLEARQLLVDGIDDAERTELLDLIEHIAQQAGG